MKKPIKNFKCNWQEEANYNDKLNKYRKSIKLLRCPFCNGRTMFCIGKHNTVIGVHCTKKMCGATIIFRTGENLYIIDIDNEEEIAKKFNEWIKNI